jgi:hypothetical protein
MTVPLKCAALLSGAVRDVAGANHLGLTQEEREIIPDRQRALVNRKEDELVKWTGTAGRQLERGC